jgi:6-phosphogluconolactonase/glucosamine-6-phosphate isomerase/deaminase
LKPVPRLRNDSDRPLPKLLQEETGAYVSISTDLAEAARHAACVFDESYRLWLERDRYNAWGRYKREHFVVAVGGGNTLKAQYRAMALQLHTKVDWLKHVRFFSLEESAGESNRQSALASLREHLLAPLAAALIHQRGRRNLLKSLKLPANATDSDIVSYFYDRMVVGMELDEVRAALAEDNMRLARRRAKAEAERYQRDIQYKLGASMEFHYIACGVGKTGSLGAFASNSPELRIRDPGVLVIEPAEGAIRVALNRGVFVNAEQVSLIVSGSLKLRALGRFEMDEVVDFEQTVMETPLRMLRETREIAEKVFIFADEQALHFDLTEFTYTENGRVLSVKAETRDGEDEGGPHALLLHGFMGLFSFTNLLVRLPSAWTVSALHRGSYAKTLDNDQIFPHYAYALRETILDLAARGHCVPVAGHSIAGVIIDHLLLSLLPDYDAPIPPYDNLKGDNRDLVDALRCAGIIQLATWAPPDGPHAGRNIKNLISHWRHDTPLDYSGLERVYTRRGGEITTTDAATLPDSGQLGGLNRFLSTPLAEPVINAANVVVRRLLNKQPVQQGMLNASAPYVLRLVGSRLLKSASIYGLCKEVNAAMHDPVQYQQRHLKALQLIAEYDIPLLSIVHEDDFLVSAKRHREEYNYLLKLRREKHGPGRARGAAGKPTTRLVILRREAAELPRDPLNPHLLVMATNNEGNRLAREITGEMTRFVNDNIDRAARAGWTTAPASVKRWRREQLTGNRKKGSAKVA